STQVCVERGWFEMPRWSTLSRRQGAVTPGLPRPRQRVFLDDFLIDREEVTAGNYSAFVATTGGAALPALCGYEDVALVGDDATWHPERSQAGSAERADHPVVCVTRSEAMAYCRERGGRLPTLAEWLKAGQPASPRATSYPWGESPPPVEFTPAWEVDSYASFRLSHALGAASDFLGAELDTQPVGERTLGASDWGVLDLAGSVSELLSDCLEELQVRYPEGAELDRPTGTNSESCEEAVLVAGSNWRSAAGAEGVGALTVYAMRDGADGFRALANDELVAGLGTPAALRRSWGRARPTGEAVTGAGNARRSWRIGFRCVYDP
ncbi:MAG: SUMF1/EgtB/PvdO family nonheme iron enzyme, partial [Myxococcota bacterium]